MNSITVYYYYYCKFFISATAVCLSMETEWQQVSLGRLDSSMYSGRFQNGYCLDLFSNFLMFLYSFQAFVGHSKHTKSPSTIIGITNNFMFYEFFSSFARSNYLPIISFSFISTLWSAGTATSSRWQVIFLFLINTRSSLLARVVGPVYIWRPQRILCISFSRIDSSLCMDEF